MKGYVANTDADWHAHLLATGPHDEVNFWQPAGGRTFRAIDPGEPIFFRLKSPLSRIGGFGRLARYEILPVQLAWDCFGPKNGTPDFADPVFFALEEYAVDQPAGWARQIVSGKTYALEHGEGRRIWEACLARVHVEAAPLAAMGEPKYGTPYVVAPAKREGSLCGRASGWSSAFAPATCCA